jgi:hypothetical protein
MRYFLAVIGLLLSFATPLFAFSATIDPSASDLTVMPGETATATISVKNDSILAKKYEISFAQAKFGKMADDISFTALSGNLKGTISATPTLFTLAAGESRMIDVSVRLPAGVPAQSPTIAVLVTEKGDQGQAGSVQASVASILFLHVPGNLTRSMIINSFIAEPSRVFGSRTTITANFTNDGQETLLLPNEIRVFGPFGREIGRGQMSVDSKHLPPGTTRAVTMTWPVDSGFHSVLLGTYRFELWDGDQNRAQATVTFVSPASLVLLGLGFVIVLLGIITIVRRRT